MSGDGYVGKAQISDFRGMCMGINVWIGFHSYYLLIILGELNKWMYA